METMRLESVGSEPDLNKENPDLNSKTPDLNVGSVGNPDIKADDPGLNPEGDNGSVTNIGITEDNKNSNGAAGLLVPGNNGSKSRATTAKSVNRGKHAGTWYGKSIPPPSDYKKPNKATLREGREQLAVMDEGRKQRLSKKMLIICAIVGAVIVVTIVIVAAVIATLPDQVIIDEVPKNLRRIDEGEVASDCIISFVGNGECDWQIQNNPHGQCDYDRKDCRESQECLELPKLLNAKDGDEKCTKAQEWSYKYPQCELVSTSFCS